MYEHIHTYVYMSRRTCAVCVTRHPGHPSKRDVPSPGIVQVKTLNDVKTLQEVEGPFKYPLHVVVGRHRPSNPHRTLDNYHHFYDQAATPANTEHYPDVSFAREVSHLTSQDLFCECKNPYRSLDVQPKECP